MLPKQPKKQPPGMSDKPKKKLNIRDLQLNKIYEATNPNSALNFEKRRLRKKAVYFYTLSLIFLILVSSATWLLLLYYKRPPAFDNSRVSLSVTAPESTHSGQPITYTIKYSNQESTALKNPRLEIHYPSNFIFTSSSLTPVTAGNNAWNLPKLNSLESGEIIVLGKLIGEVGMNEIVSVTLKYQPENFSSFFSQNASSLTTFKEPLITVEIDGHSETKIGEEILYQITVTNNQDYDLDNLQLIVLYPPNFQTLETVPQEDSQTNGFNNITHMFSLGQLAAQQKFVVKIKGAFTENMDLQTESRLTAALMAKNGANTQYLLSQKSFVTDIFHDNIIANMFINGSNLDQTLNIRDSLSYQLNFKNLTGKRYYNNTIALEIAENTNGVNLIDFNNPLNKSDKFDLQKKDGNTILYWTPKTLPALSIIEPQQEISLQFSLKLLPFKNSLSRLADGKIIQKLKLTSFPEQGTQLPAITQTKEITSSIESDFSISGFARYYNDQKIQVGSGPMPPLTNQKTTYQITLEINNNIHEMDNVTVSTALADKVIWENKYETNIGEVSYNNTTHSLSWKINRLLPNFGESFLRFMINVTPTSENLHNVVNLTDMISASGYDKNVNLILQSFSDIIDSNLKGDPLVEGLGIVRDK